MICVDVSGYTKPCGPSNGGVGLLWVADAADFDFTQGAPDANGDPTGYDGIERRVGATSAGGAFFYPIDSIYDTTGVTITQSNANGFSSSYAYQIVAQVGGMSQQMTNFFKKLDAAAACCQLIFAWFTNDGKIHIAGEKFVDGALIPPFRLRQDGTTLQTGLNTTEFNGANFSVRGNYSRAPYEFTGGISVIQALQPS